MDKFDKLFHLFYESINDNYLKLNGNFDFLNDFLKNAVKFKNNLIIENKHLLLDVPNESIDFFLKNTNKLIIGKDFKTTFKNSKHWRNLKNIDFKKQFFALFDFSSDADIESFFSKCFDISSIDEIIKKRNEFKENIDYNLDGFYTEFDNSYIFCINLKSTNLLDTIYHELSHLIQKIGNIRITKSYVKEPSIEIINILGKDFFKIIEYFSVEEFNVHLDDLLIEIKSLKNKFYENEKDIINVIIMNLMKIKTNNDLMNNDLVKKYSIVNNGDIGNLLFLFVSYKMNLKFQKIILFLIRKINEI